MTPVQHKIAERVTDALMPEIKTSAPEAVRRFMGDTLSGTDPRNSMAACMLAFVCVAVQHGKLALVARDAVSR